MKNVCLLLTAFLILSISALNNKCNAQWIPLNNGIPSGQFVTALSVYGNILYAGTNAGIYKSTNAGVNWLALVTNTGSILSFAFNGNYYYASTANGYWKSSNSGLNWALTNFYGNPPVWSMSASNGNVYCVIGADRVWKTTNNGLLWEPVSPGGDVRYVSANEPYVYAGFYNYSTGVNGGVYRSSNSGANWVRTIQDINIYCLSQSDSFVYAGAVDDTLRNGGVYVSTNYGVDWSRSSLDSVPVKTLYAFGNYVFAGVENTYYPGFTEYPGFWVSTNNGQTWTKRNEGYTNILANIPVVAIAVLDNNVYTALSGGGIWQRPLSQIIGIKNISSEIPTAFSLEQNYPNPFNSITNIKWQIANAGIAKITVYDLLGKEVAVPLNEFLQPGTYQVNFNAQNLSSGVYFYQLKTDNFIETKKLILLK